jgi:ADP-heptose:LPS heptosyltransferase
VLILRLSAMGDVVQSLGPVQALAEARPDIELHWIVQSTFAPLLDGVSGLASVIGHDRRGGVSAYLRTARVLRRLRPSVALDLQGNWKSAGLARLSGAAERIGARAPARQEPASGMLLTRLVDSPARHPFTAALAVVRDVAPSTEALDPRLSPGVSELEAEAAAVRRLGLDPTRPFRVLVLVDPSDCRAQRPGAIEREVQAVDLPVLALTGPEERGLEAPPGVPVLRHRAGEIRRLVALGGLVADAGGEVFGPDTGAVHILAATGARTLVAFGPNTPQRTGPPAAEVCRHPAPPGCAPCDRRQCRHQDGPVCMDFTSAVAHRSGFRSAMDRS